MTTSQSASAPVKMAPDQPHACPLCGSETAKSFVRTWESFQLFDCPACGIGYCMPFKNPGAGYYEEYEDLYPREAMKTTSTMSLEYDETLEFLRRGAKGKRLLDIGFGGGAFLYQAKLLGFDVTGIDFDKQRLELVRSQLGIEKVYEGSIQDFAKNHPDERFDVATIFQVLEHLDNPADWLRVAHGLLKPGGLLFVGVPNRERTFDPFSGHYGMVKIDNPPNHLTRWNAGALSRFVEKQGFRVLEARSLRDRLPLLALMLRDKLSFGLATRALQVDQMRHLDVDAARGKRKIGARERLVQTLVAVKSIGIDAAACLLYPVYRLLFPVVPLQGVVLYCVAQKTGKP